MNKALLVIDMQNDYLWDKRQDKFSYNTKELVDSVNNVIDKYKNECDVIYISHLIQNIITNRLLFGFSIEGTEGAKLYSGLNVVSTLKFNKYFKDAYKSKEFKKYMDSKKYEEVYICGLDQCGCVYHTALGALKNNSKVFMIENAIGCRYSSKKYNDKKSKLIEKGAKYI